VPAAGSATKPTFQVINRSEDQILSFEVIVLGVEWRRRRDRRRILIHAHILSLVAAFCASF
jgi:hypothetical protein